MDSLSRIGARAYAYAVECMGHHVQPDDTRPPATGDSPGFARVFSSSMCGICVSEELHPGDPGGGSVISNLRDKTVIPVACSLICGSAYRACSANHSSLSAKTGSKTKAMEGKNPVHQAASERDLSQLPDELLNDIIARIDEADQLALFQTCRRACDLILPHIGATTIALPEPGHEEEGGPGGGPMQLQASKPSSLHPPPHSSAWKGAHACILCIGIPVFLPLPV